MKKVEIMLIFFNIKAFNEVAIVSHRRKTSKIQKFHFPNVNMGDFAICTIWSKIDKICEKKLAKIEIGPNVVRAHEW